MGSAGAKATSVLLGRVRRVPARRRAVRVGLGRTGRGLRRRRPPHLPGRRLPSDLQPAPTRGCPTCSSAGPSWPSRCWPPSPASAGSTPERIDRCASCTSTSSSTARAGPRATWRTSAALQEQAGHEVGFWGMDHPENTHLELADTFPSHVEFDDPPPGVVERAKMVGRMVWSIQARRAWRRPSTGSGRTSPTCTTSTTSSRRRSWPAHRAGVPVVMTLHDYKLVCPTYQLLDQGEVCEACVAGKFWNAPVKRCRNGSLLASATMAVETSVHTLLRSTATSTGSSARAGSCRPDGARPGLPGQDARHPPLRRPGRRGAQGGAGRQRGRRRPALGGEGDRRRHPGHRPPARPAHLDIAGDGPVRADLEALAARTRRAGSTFHGRLPKDQLFDLLRRSSVAVVPSTWYENQPMAVLEAMAIGLPVIGTDLGGIPELIDAGPTGRWCRRRRPGAGRRHGRRAGRSVSAFDMGQNGGARSRRTSRPRCTWNASAGSIAASAGGEPE